MLSKITLTQDAHLKITLLYAIFFCKEALFEGPYEIGMYVVLTIFVSLGAFHKLCHQKLRFVDTLSVLINLTSSF